MVSDEPCPTDCPNRNVPASVPRPRLRSLRKPSSFSLSLGNSIINFRVLHLFLLKRIADRERSHRAKSEEEDGPLRGPRRIAPPGRITRAASRPQTDRSARPPGTLDGPRRIAPPGPQGRWTAPPGLLRPAATALTANAPHRCPIQAGLCRRRSCPRAGASPFPPAPLPPTPPHSPHPPWKRNGRSIRPSRLGGGSRGAGGKRGRRPAGRPPPGGRTAGGITLLDREPIHGQVVAASMPPSPNVPGRSCNVPARHSPTRCTFQRRTKDPHRQHTLAAGASSLVSPKEDCGSREKP